MAINKVSVKRWTKISLRTLHLLSVAGVGGGIMFGLDNSLWISYWWLALISGGLMMAVDILSNRVWLVQIRGLTIFLKLLLLALLGVNPAWDGYLLVTIIVISGIISHAPGRLRYYSIYHRKVITSNLDTKG